LIPISPKQELNNSFYYFLDYFRVKIYLDNDDQEGGEIMKKLCKTVSLLIVALFVFSSMSFMGCTKHSNAEQLQALEEQKNAALSAENTLEEKRREKNELQSKLKQKRDELQATKEELETVKQRVGQ